MSASGQQQHLAWSESVNAGVQADPAPLHLLPQLLYQYIASRFQHFKSSCHSDMTSSASPWWWEPEREFGRPRVEELSDQELNNEEEDGCTDTEVGK